MSFTSENLAYNCGKCSHWWAWITLLYVLTGTMTILRYFHKCNSSALKPANVLGQLQTAANDCIHVDSLETEVCLHIELKHGEGSLACFNLLFLLSASSTRYTCAWCTECLYSLVIKFSVVYIFIDKWHGMAHIPYILRLTCLGRTTVQQGTGLSPGGGKI